MRPGEVAERVGLSTQSVSKWARFPELAPPGFPMPRVLPSGHRRWRRDQIDAWLDGLGLEGGDEDGGAPRQRDAADESPGPEQPEQQDPST